MPVFSVSFALHLQHLLRQVDVVAVLDIALVATAVYYLLALARGTRAMQLLKGLAILLVVMKGAQFLGLDTLYWFISQALFASAVVLVILFQPELRAALDRLGRSRLEVLGLRLQQNVSPAQGRAIEEITRAVTGMAATKTGALIAVERATGLEDIAATGTALDAQVSAELLGAIFHEGNPLHDGGAIVKGEKIEAAACILPLSTDAKLPRTVGTRHRAALGLSETTDALVIVVSEETGNISLAREGTMTSILQPRLLAEELSSIFRREQGAARLRPFARQVGNAARQLPRTTLGTLRAVLRKG